MHMYCCELLRLLLYTCIIVTVTMHMYVVTITMHMYYYDRYYAHVLL